MNSDGKLDILDASGVKDENMGGIMNNETIVVQPITAEVKVEQNSAIKVEEVKTEQLSEKVVEAPKEVLKVEPVVEPAKEQLSIEKLKEQLSIIKETREELAKVYVDMEKLGKESSELKNSNTELLSKVDTFSKEKETLSAQLKESQEKLAKIEETELCKRLEKLSASFKQLGQDKSVEQLKALPVAMISEFEQVVNAGLSAKRQNEKLGETITHPSQAVATEKLEEKKPEALVKPKPFFTEICDEMAKQQGKEGVFGNKSVRVY